MYSEYIQPYFTEHFVGSIIQILTVIPYSIAFWRDKKNNILMWVAFSSVLFAIGYYLFRAYSGVVISIGSIIATFIGYYFIEKKGCSVKLRFLLFSLLVIGTVLVCVCFEWNKSMIYVLIAGSLGYLSFIVFRKYDTKMHFFLILMQFTYIIYEVIYQLFLFALLDLVTMLVIILHLVKHVSAHKKAV